MSVQNLEPYRGKWIAILDNKVIAEGMDLKKVYEEAMQKSKGRTPLFNRVPEKDEDDTLIL